MFADGLNPIAAVAVVLVALRSLIILQSVLLGI